MPYGLDLSRVAGLNLLNLPRHVVLVHPLRVANRLHHQRGAPLVRLHQRRLDAVVDRRLLRGHEPRAHVHAVGAQREARGELLSGADAPRRHVRDRQRRPRLGQQHEVAHVVLARVTRALEPVHGYAVGAEPLRGERVLDRDALVHHRDAVLLEEGDPLARISARGLHHRHALVDDHLGVGAVVGGREARQKRKVHRERLTGLQQSLARADLVPEELRRALGQGGDGAEPARVGHRRREGGVPDVVHAPLDDGVLDLEQLGDPGLENHGVEVARAQPQTG